MLSETRDPDLELLFERFEKNNREISVDFRKLVCEIRYNSERYTHAIHSYPAKLIPHIPYFFTSSGILSGKGDRILDPFCGTGTVLLEALMQGRDVVGTDSNPLARLITKVKLTPLSESEFKKELTNFESRYQSEVENPVPPFEIASYWFYPHVIKKLNRIISVINQIEIDDIRDLFRVSFSSIVKKVSLSDLRVPVPVRIKPEKYPPEHWLRAKSEERLRALKRVNVYQIFISSLMENKRLIDSTFSKAKFGRFLGLGNDARKIAVERPGGGRRVNKDSVQLIVTSPPYLGAQKYIRSSSLSLGWLGYLDDCSLRDFEKGSIGREHYNKSEYCELQVTGLSSADVMLRNIYQANPLRAHIASNYLIEFRDCLKEWHRVLRTGGFFVLVIAPNQVLSETFPTHKFCCELARLEGFGLKLSMIDSIKSRGLMTRRNKTASVIASEWVFVFEKQ